MGTERKVPEFPYGLRGRGKRFWREIWASYDLEKDEAELFVEVCRSLDLVEDLFRGVHDEGVVVYGSMGQIRHNPLIGELRQTQLAIGKLLAQLGLPDVEGHTLPSPVQTAAKNGSAAQLASSGLTVSERNRRAAVARWDKVGRRVT
jgi:hypothetical protein